VVSARYVGGCLDFYHGLSMFCLTHSAILFASAIGRFETAYVHSKLALMILLFFKITSIFANARRGSRKEELRHASSLEDLGPYVSFVASSSVAQSFAYTARSNGYLGCKVSIQPVMESHTGLVLSNKQTWTRS
jgi:hypothetical protein